MTDSPPRYILLIGGNPIQAFEGQFYTSSAYAKHVHSLADLVDHVVFYGYINYTDLHPGGMLLDSDRVHVKPSLFYSTKKNLFNLLRDFHFLRKSAAGSLGWIESFPTAGGMFSPIYRLNGRMRKLVYLKTDYKGWLEQISNSVSNGAVHRLRKYYYGWSQDYSVKAVDIVLVRGEQLISEYANKAKEIHLSLPIASFDNSFAYQRKDTCTGKCIKLLFVGRLMETKGIFDLLNAVARAQSRLIGIKTLELTLIGEEFHSEGKVSIQSIYEFANKLGIGEQITCTGQIEDSTQLAQYYRDADIFVLPSWHEGFPRVINEALLFSLPVITTAVGGIPSALDDQNEVLLVQPKCSDEIATAICTIIESSDVRHRLIVTGHDWALAHMPEPAWMQHARLMGLIPSVI